VTGVQTCALPIAWSRRGERRSVDGAGVAGQIAKFFGRGSKRDKTCHRDMQPIALGRHRKERMAPNGRVAREGMPMKRLTILAGDKNHRREEPTLVQPCGEVSSDVPLGHFGHESVNRFDQSGRHILARGAVALELIGN